MPFHSHVLANGLRIVGETNPAARSVALGFFVRTGARDETSEVSGVTHFLEHMVFKGTERRTALDVNRDFDRIGAHYNAYTSEENTVFHAAILPDYLPQAVDILADILRPSLRQEDFDMEKQVIIEEIGMYDDQPQSSAYDHARRFYFSEHPLGNSVLGTVASIQALRCEQMREYFQRRYVAPNIIVSAAGNLNWPFFVELLEKACGHWKSGEAPRDHVRHSVGKGGVRVVKKEKVSQEYVIIMSPGPALNSPLRYAADTLAVAIGDDSGSRLYWQLVDPGLAESADLSFHEYHGTGVFYASFSGEPDQTADNLKIMRDVLVEVQQNGITQQELQQAQSKIMSRVVRVGERPGGRMQTVGINWAYLEQYRTVDEELRAFEAVTLDSIREQLDRFPLDQSTTLALGPLAELVQ